MIAAAALGNVMQQDRHIEHLARNHLAQDRGRQRMILTKRAFFDPREQANGADRMFINGIMMVHVKLHLRDDPAKVGNKAAKNAGFVHPAQHAFRIAL